MVGMDFISVTSRHHRMEGRAAHRALLDPKCHGNPLLVVEDMALSRVFGKLCGVIIFPLVIQDSAGAPGTVLGYVF